jgi:hypothetical protein
MLRAGDEGQVLSIQDGKICKDSVIAYSSLINGKLSIYVPENFIIITSTQTTLDLRPHLRVHPQHPLALIYVATLPSCSASSIIPMRPKTK